jgi:SAM-dependent methyltransferase
MSVSRKFEWLSSNDPANASALITLQNRMSAFYSSQATRAKYQQLISVSNSAVPDDPVTQAFLDWFKQNSFSNIVEIGCGNGRIWNFLQQHVKAGCYTGIEVDEVSIQQNAVRWPDQNWIQADAYAIPVADSSVDLLMSFYVLEHLVHPVRALESMYRKLMQGGYLLLVFPDFTVTGRFPSQHLGLGVRISAKEKLRKGRIWDAILSVYDSRIRLQKALAAVRSKPGDFVVNANPVCLADVHGQVWPDYDAVYVASKVEVQHWFQQRGAIVTYPFGIQHPFDEHTFMLVEKRK